MSATVTREQVQPVVYDALADLGPEKDQITDTATWEELDIDSLDLAELSQVVEEEFGVRLKGDDVAKIKTVGEAVDLITERASS
jgi:acyl carrier protein